MKRLFFDIETSYCEGWFWRPQFKTNITYDQVLKDNAIICICYKWEGTNKTYHLEWDKGSDKAMIKKFYDVLLLADEVVGHNGDNFDMKWVRTRCLLHGVKSMPEIKTIDTLKIARSKFKFKSNRLDNIGKELGFGGKKDTGGIELWHDIIQRNSKSSMKKMVDYCKRDVELLEKIYVKLSGFANPKTNVAVLNEGHKWDCPNCGHDKIQVRANIVSYGGGLKKRCSCGKCHKWFTISGSTYVALQKFRLKQQMKKVQDAGDLLKKVSRFNLE